MAAPQQQSRPAPTNLEKLKRFNSASSADKSDSAVTPTEDMQLVLNRSVTAHNCIHLGYKLTN